MARLTISLLDEIFDELKGIKPSHRPMSQHIADLIVEAMDARKRMDARIRKACIDDKQAEAWLKTQQQKGLLLKNERRRTSDSAQTSDSYFLPWQPKSLKNESSNKEF